MHNGMIENYGGKEVLMLQNLHQHVCVGDFFIEYATQEQDTIPNFLRLKHMIFSARLDSFEVQTFQFTG